jgi:hypothetical protein
MGQLLVNTGAKALRVTMEFKPEEFVNLSLGYNMKEPRI